MAKLSEQERAELAVWVAEKVDEIGMTEASRLTGLSSTAIRSYTTGINPGVRAATVKALRALVSTSDRAAPLDPIAAMDARLTALEAKVDQLLQRAERRAS